MKIETNKINANLTIIRAIENNEEVGFMNIGKNKLGYYIINTEVIENYRNKGIYNEMRKTALNIFFWLNSFSRSDIANAIYEKQTGKLLETNQLVKISYKNEIKVTKKLI